MPKIGCNGFSLFAEQMRGSLEEKLGKELGRFSDIAKAAAPYWTGLPEEEKKGWKERARCYKRSDEYAVRRQLARMQNLDARERRRDCDADEEAAGDDDDMEYDHEYGLEEGECDPMELPGPVQRHPNRLTVNELFNCLPGGDFSWEKKGISPTELGQMCEDLAPLTGGVASSSAGGGKKQSSRQHSVAAAPSTAYGGSVRTARLYRNTNSSSHAGVSTVLGSSLVP